MGQTALRFWIGLAAFSANALWSFQAAAAIEFDITVLNAPPGFSEPFALAINADAAVVGSAATGTGVQRAVSFAPTAGTNLTAFLTSSTDSFALGMNASGQVVGYYNDRFEPALTPHAALYSLSGGVVTTLGALPGSSRTDSKAYAINSGGAIVGWAADSGGRRHAVRFSLSGNVDLGGGRDSQAFDINDSGQAVGVSVVPVGSIEARHATLFATAGNVDLGSLLDPHNVSVAVAINNAGWAVGYTELDGDNDRATLFANGQTLDLGTLGASSRASDISNNGWVVGFTEKDLGHGVFKSTPFLWSQAQGMRALEDLIDPASGWGLSQDQDAAPIINDKGQVVMLGFNPSVGSRLLLLSPTPVPEPAHWALILAGVGVVGTIVRRRRLLPSAD